MPQHSHAPALLILNGKGAGNEELRQAVKRLRAEQITLYVRVTWEHGDAARYVAEAAQLGVGTVVAGGGDGTINEVAAALMQLPAHNRPVLGILPLGTANDFAMACNIPRRRNRRCSWRSRAARCRSIWPKSTANATSSTWPPAARHPHHHRNAGKLKAALGVSFVHGLLRMDTLQADRCEIRGPDFRWAGEALVIGIGNGKQAGGGQELCPSALINDGLLQLRLLIADELLPALVAALFNDERATASSAQRCRGSDRRAA